MSTLLERLWYPDSAESWSRKLALSPLLLAEGAFRAGVGLRGALYDRGLLKSHRPEGPRIVSVGNLNVGGAGKTPLTIHLANRLQQQGERVVVLTRGYGRTSQVPVEISAHVPRPTVGEAGDEPLLIADSCPGVPVLVGSNRVALAGEAVARHRASVLLLDDGLQHRRLARDLDVVVIDASARFGNGHLMPRGPLREPLAALSRASLACLRVSQGVEVPRLELPIPYFVARYLPGGWRDEQGRSLPLAALTGGGVVALTAIARPSAFQSTLVGAGLRVEQLISYPDHHPFTEAELEAARAAAAGRVIVTTEKDRLRLPSGFPAWALRMELRIEEGAELLERALAPGARHGSGPAPA
ncbi:MAG: tetraacyldisaccharide 4'-kinase [Myxococcota bacterium]|nr:tetraacyldisaccharide 4'-kinase [Myxococcota bacterium]